MAFAALLNLSDDKIPWLRRSKIFGAAIKPLLDALVLEDQMFLKMHNAPKLYQSRVVYREEPPTIVTKNDGTPMVIEEFAAAPIVFARGWGDCDDLAPLRCAELRNAGERATLRIIWKTQPESGQKLYHILVRRPDARDFDARFMVRAPDGSVIEDPSFALGMPYSILTMKKDAYLTS